MCRKTAHGLFFLVTPSLLWRRLRPATNVQSLRSGSIQLFCCGGLLKVVDLILDGQKVLMNTLQAIIGRTKLLVLLIALLAKGFNVAFNLNFSMTRGFKANHTNKYMITAPMISPNWNHATRLKNLGLIASLSGTYILPLPHFLRIGSRRMLESAEDG
jgi:hypothetical protein